MRNLFETSFFLIKFLCSFVYVAFSRNGSDSFVWLFSRAALNDAPKLFWLSVSLYVFYRPMGVWLLHLWLLEDDGCDDVHCFHPSPMRHRTWQVSHSL